MGHIIINRREFNTHSGTENLYWTLFKEYPGNDISVNNLSMLYSILGQLPSKKKGYLLRFYGIGCARSTYAEIARDAGLKYSTGISTAIWDCIRRLYRYDRVIQLLYTPFFPELWHCTEIGYCPLYHGIGSDRENKCQHDLCELIECLLLKKDLPCEHIKQLQKRFSNTPVTFNRNSQP